MGTGWLEPTISSRPRRNLLNLPAGRTTPGPWPPTAMRLRVNSLPKTLPNLLMYIGAEAMLTGNTRRASRLTLALGGLFIAATVSAADVQSQARGVLIGHRSTRAAAS